MSNATPLIPISTARCRLSFDVYSRNKLNLKKQFSFFNDYSFIRAVLMNIEYKFYRNVAKRLTKPGLFAFKYYCKHQSFVYRYEFFPKFDRIITIVLPFLGDGKIKIQFAQHWLASYASHLPRLGHFKFEFRTFFHFLLYSDRTRAYLADWWSTMTYLEFSYTPTTAPAVYIHIYIYTTQQCTVAENQIPI